MIISALKFRTLPATRRSDREILVVAFRSASTWQARMADSLRREVSLGRTVA